MRRYLLPLGITAGVLAIVGAFVPVLAAVGGVISIAVFLVEHRTRGPAVIPFTVDDWIAVDDRWELRVPQERHGRRDPSGSTWRNTEDGWGEVYAAPLADDDGNLTVRLNSGEPFDGQVRVT